MREHVQSETPRTRLRRLESVMAVLESTEGEVGAAGYGHRDQRYDHPSPTRLDCTNDFDREGVNPNPLMADVICELGYDLTKIPSQRAFHRSASSRTWLRGALGTLRWAVAKAGHSANKSLIGLLEHPGIVILVAPPEAHVHRQHDPQDVSGAGSPLRDPGPEGHGADQTVCR